MCSEATRSGVRGPPGRHRSRSRLGGVVDGALLRAAAQEFDAFITVDQGVQFQQNLAGARIRVVVLVADRNTFDALRPLIPKVLEALRTLRVGELIRIAG